MVVTALLDAGDTDAGPRVAYAIGRHVGPAVVRNRVRRRMRAVARELELAPGAYLVTADPGVVALDFGDLRRHLAAAVRKATA